MASSNRILYPVTHAALATAESPCCHAGFRAASSLACWSGAESGPYCLPERAGGAG